METRVVHAMTDVLIPHLAYHQRKSIACIEPWLKAHNFARPAERISDQKELGGIIAQSIYDVRLPDHWVKVQNLRAKIRDAESDEQTSPNALLQYRFDVGRAALKACEDARRAYVYMSAAEKSVTLRDASAKSWVGLNKYADEVMHSGRPLPKASLLELPLGEAINSYWENKLYKRPAPTYIGMVGLAAVVLSQQTRDESEKYTFVWIKPGTPDNVYEQWDHA